MAEKILSKKKFDPRHIEPGLDPCIVVTVVAKIDKVQQRLDSQKYKYKGIYVSIDKYTTLLANHLPEDQSVVIIQSADLNNNFDCDVE